MGYGKRSADAEPKADADPYLLYGGYHGLGYSGYHYPAYGHVAYYGKRSAEADPYLLYGGYHGVGYAGYHYPAYGHVAYYGKRFADAEPYVYRDTMDLVDTVVLVDMDLDVVSTMDKQRIS